MRILSFAAVFLSAVLLSGTAPLSGAAIPQMKSGGPMPEAIQTTCPATPITLPQTVGGTLTTTDCQYFTNWYYDFYRFTLTQPTRLRISLTSPASMSSAWTVEYSIGAGWTIQYFYSSGSREIDFPAGTHDIAVSTDWSRVTGSYTLTVEAVGGGGGTSYRFIPVTPCRVADTRPGEGKTGLFGPPFLPAGGTREIPVPSSGCGIPTTARAYALNFTVVPRGPLSYLTTWPWGQPQPFVSTLNSFHGGVVANAAIVPAGSNGSIQVFVTDPTDVIIDIVGYFADSSASNAFDFFTLNPCRAVDTRFSGGFTGMFGPPSLGGGVSRDFPLLSSVCGVPASARAYSLNATVVPIQPLGYLTLYPSGNPLPLVSTLNSFEGLVVANAALVPGGNGSAISAFASNPTDLILDVNGYFAPPAGGSLRFNPVAPCRVADTRGGQGPVMTGGSTRSFAVAGTCGIPANASAYSLNVTVVPTGALGYLSMWPTGQPQPVVSTLNSFQGRILANAAIVPSGVGGTVSVFVTNTTHVVLDINGYFAPSGGTVTPPQITSVNPSSGQAGQVVNLAISGTNLGGVTGIQFSPPDGITVSNIVASSSLVTATVAISAGAAAGTRNVSVTGAQGASNALLFQVTGGGGGSYDGNWAGITNQGRNMSFVVQNNRVMSYAYGFSYAPCGTNSNVTATVTGGLAITGGSFSSTNFSGTFDSAVAAHGTIGWNLSIPGCYASGTLTFTAVKQ